MRSLMVLGGTADQVDLLLQLRDRGYLTILVDSCPSPVARPYCDLHVQESNLDRGAVLQLARKHRVDNIIATCGDTTLLTVAYVAEQLGFQRQFSYQQVVSMTNKVYMKEVMTKSGIPTARFKRIDGWDENITQGMSFPLMVKPSDCNGSRGVRKANNEAELKSFVASALAISRSKLAVVEEFKEGTEISVDCYVKDGSARIVMMSQLNKKPIGDSVNLIFQTVVPAQVPDSAQRRIVEVAGAIVKAFKIDNTPLLMQLLLNGDDVNVIEMAPRIGGGSKHREIRRVTGFDILNANIDAILHGTIPEMRIGKASGYYSRNYIYVLPSTYGWCSNYKELLEDGTILEFIINKTRGLQIADDLASRSRVANFLVGADSKERLMRRIRRAVDRLEVYDTKGVPVMRKDVFC